MRHDDDDASQWFMSIKLTIATLARAPEALLIVPKPYVKCMAEGVVSSVEERIGSDADCALR